MGTVLIRCPTSKSLVFTGVTMDYETFFETDIGDRQSFCPVCGEIHRWSQKNAWLKDWPEHEGQSAEQS